MNFAMNFWQNQIYDYELMFNNNKKKINLKNNNIERGIDTICVHFL